MNNNIKLDVAVTYMALGMTMLFFSSLLKQLSFFIIYHGRNLINPNTIWDEAKAHKSYGRPTDEFARLQADLLVKHKRCSRA